MKKIMICLLGIFILFGALGCTSEIDVPIEENKVESNKEIEKPNSNIEITVPEIKEPEKPQENSIIPEVNENPKKPEIINPAPIEKPIEKPEENETNKPEIIGPIKPQPKPEPEKPVEKPIEKPEETIKPRPILPETTKPEIQDPVKPIAPPIVPTPEPEIPETPKEDIIIPEDPERIAVDKMYMVKVADLEKYGVYKNQIRRTFVPGNAEIVTYENPDGSLETVLQTQKNWENMEVYMLHIGVGYFSNDTNFNYNVYGYSRGPISGKALPLVNPENKTTPITEKDNRFATEIKLGDKITKKVNSKYYSFDPYSYLPEIPVICIHNPNEENAWAIYWVIPEELYQDPNWPKTAAELYGNKPLDDLFQYIHLTIMRNVIRGGIEKDILGK